MRRFSRIVLMLPSLLSVCLPFCTTTAEAHGRHAHRGHSLVHRALYRSYGPARVIQCVAFAKWDTGMQLSGNARDWWYRAAGLYARGQRPEGGSVLSFSPNARMPLGHVAVVAGIEDPRTILIDQSHWASRGISRGIEVKDVSENNDWSAVRVQLERGGGFGSIYPTHGFIYPRPDEARGRLVANDTRAPMPRLDDAPADLRARSSRHRMMPIEVAEVADPAPRRGLDLNIPIVIGDDAPDRAFK